jgi:hypothetical protein
MADLKTPNKGQETVDEINVLKETWQAEGGAPPGWEEFFREAAGGLGVSVEMRLASGDRSGRPRAVRPYL